MAQTPEAYSNQKAPPPKKTTAAPAAAPPAHGAPPPPGHFAGPPQGAPPQRFEPGYHGPGGPGERPHYGYYQYRERNFERFNFEEQERWRAGYWRQDWHDGRYGWWWWNDGYWYSYPAPIYPYPLIVSDDYYREPDAVEPAPDMQPPALAPQGPPQQFWYYCDDPAGYSPYVQACNVPWRAVPVMQQPPPPPQ
jgi:hypothetical protein